MGLSWSSPKSPPITKMKIRTTSSIYTPELDYHKDTIVRNLVSIKIHPEKPSELP
jgi:hypothetical protein